MMKQYILPFLVGVALVACMLVSWQIGRARGYASGYADGSNIPVKSDTLWRVDTLLIDRPVPVYTTIEKPVYLAVTDTMLVSIHDTTFVALQRTAKGYSGEDYAAQVSGVEPALDWIRVYPKTATITNTVQDTRRWTFGLAAGPGIVWNGKVHGGVGIVAGLQYRF